MLGQLGTLTFEVAPFNLHELDFEGEARFAEHQVLGKQPTLEFVGEGNETWRIRGRILKEIFQGGMSELDTLQGMRRTGRPQPWMRGDGSYMGWVKIERVSERATYLDAQGVPKWLEFEATLRKSDPPNAAGMFNILVGLFG